jgi:hypothetical protein
MDDKVDIRQPVTAKPVADIPATIEERAVVLTGLMERMTAQLDRETEYLKTNRHGDLSTLVAEKQAMVATAEEMGRLLRIDRDGLFNLPPDLDAPLRAANRALQRAVEENVETLQRSIGAQRLLVGIVVDTLNRGRQNEQPAYSPPPSRDANPRARRTYTSSANLATSAALNTRI